MNQQDKIYMIEFIKEIVDKNTNLQFYEISSRDFHNQYIEYLKQHGSDGNCNSLSTSIILSLLNINGITIKRTRLCNIKCFEIEEVKKSLSEYQITEKVVRIPSDKLKKKQQEQTHMIKFIREIVDKNTDRQFYEISSRDFHNQYIEYLNQLGINKNYNSLSISSKLSLLNINGITIKRTRLCNFKRFEIEEVKKSLINR